MTQEKQPGNVPLWMREREADIQAGATGKPAAIIDVPKRNYWEDPKRVARYRNMLRSAPPTFEAPAWLDRNQIEQAYQYLKFRNNDKPWTEWQMLADDDPGTSFIRSMPDPPEQFKPAYEQDWTKVNPYTPTPDTEPFGNWDNLDWYEKAYLTIFSPQPGLAGRPGASRATAAGARGIISALPAAGIGALVGGPVGALVAGVGVGLGTAYQEYTGNEIPFLGQALEALDVLSIGAEKVWGLTDQARLVGVQAVLDDLPAAWQAAGLKYETQQADLLNTWMGLFGEHAAADQVWQISKGFTDPQKLQGSTARGAEAQREIVRRLQAGEDWLTLYSEYVERFGDTGTFNDFVMGTLVDPANLVPFVGGKVGKGIAKGLGQERLATAIGEGIGNPFADILEGVPIAGNLVNKALGIHGSEGLITSIQKYQGWIKTGYFPTGTTPTRADALSSFEKWAGGLDEQGRIKELLPRQGKQNFIQYLNSLTPEAQAHAFMSSTHDGLNVVMSLADGDPRRMVKMLRQAAGIEPVDIAHASNAIVNSPVMVTVAQSLRDVLKDNWDQELLLRYEQAGPQRDMLAKAAQALGEKPADILEQYKDNPGNLMRRIEAAGGPAGDPAQLQAVFEVFTGDDALPWSENQFQAQLAVTLFDKMDQSLAQRYGLKPDSAVLRLSQTLKGMQSLLLLGFNPSYFINNQVNNMVTRAATGVFGYMTPRQIAAFNERFGITPHRLADALDPSGTGATTGKGGMVIADAKRAGDLLGKAYQVVTKTNQKLGIFSRFSSAGEALESSNAYAIGTRKFFGRAWKKGKGLRPMNPAVEAALDRAAPGVKHLIYQAIESGMNMREIEAGIFGNVMRPQIKGILEDAARRIMPDDPQSAVDLFTSQGILDRLESSLINAETPEQARRAFDRVEGELKAIADEYIKRETVTRAEDVANRIQAEGTNAVLETLDGLTDRVSRRKDASMQTFERVELFAEQTFAGILKGVGRKGQEAQAISAKVIQARKAFNIFKRERKKLIRQLAKADPARARELRLQLDDLHRSYAAEAQAYRDALNEMVEAKRRPQTPPAAATPRQVELKKLAVEFGLVDMQGRGVIRQVVNVVNRYRPKDQRYTDPDSVPLDEAQRALEAHRASNEGIEADAARQLALEYDEIIAIADNAARQAEIEANGMLTRRMVREQFRDAFKADEAKLDAAMVIMDLHADQVAKAQGKTPSQATRDAWYATRIAGVVDANNPVQTYENLYQEQYGNLVALHNVSADKLLEAADLGGLPVPSIAILPAGNRFEGYGDITLIARRETIDPRANRQNRVFDADAYTPRGPRPVYKPVKTKKAQEILRQFGDITNEFDDYFTGELWDYMVQHPNPQRALELFDKHVTPMVAFLRGKGIDVQPVKIAPRLRYGWIQDASALHEFVRNNEQAIRDMTRDWQTMYDNPLYAQIREHIAQGIEDAYSVITDKKFQRKLKDSAWEMLTVDDDLQAWKIDEIIEDVNKAIHPENQVVDKWKTRDAVTNELKRHGLEAEYRQHVKSIIAGTFEAPLIRVRGKLVPQTLHTIVEAMTSQKKLRGGEETTGFGPNKARAESATELKSIDQMHKAEDKLVDHDAFRRAVEEQEIALDPWKRAVIASYQVRGWDNTWAALDDSMRVLAIYLKGGKKRSASRMREAIARADLDVNFFTPEKIDQALYAAEALARTPTEYFEAKPQRAVYFEELAGAVVPKNADPAVFEALDRRGVEYRTYDTDDPNARKAAVESFYTEEGVLFQTAAERRANIHLLQDAGFVSPEAVRHVFTTPDGTTPAYLRAIARFIMDRRARYLRGDMTVRDVAKAYLMTVASQGSDARSLDTVQEGFRAAGLTLTQNGAPMDLTQYAHPTIVREKLIEQALRPEEVAGVWLLSDQGRAALDALERGEVTDAWLTFAEGRKSFGRFGTGRAYKWETITNPDGTQQKVKRFTETEGEWLTKPGARAGFNLNQIQQVTDAINAAKGDPAKMRAAVQMLTNIGDGKAGFMKHMIGFADETTLDSQQANFWKSYLGNAPKNIQELFDRGTWGKKEVIEPLKEMVEGVYWKLRAEGIATDIPEEAFTHIMHHWLWDAQKGIQSEHKAVYDALELAQQRKGGVSFQADGRALIRAIEAPDVSTMMHEIGHIFRRDLNEADLNVVARIGGLESGAELITLERKFLRGEIQPGDPEYKAYVNAEEYFARAWERYLIEGDAPTSELRGVFGKFTDWMLKVYGELKHLWNSAKSRREVNYFDRQSEFVIDGRTVSLQMQIDGVPLRDIFDRMLVDKRVDIEDAGEPGTPAPSPVDSGPQPGTPGNPGEIAIRQKPVKELPAHIQAVMKEIARVLIGELSEARPVKLVNEVLEGGAVVDEYRSINEGPAWYKELYAQEEAAKGKKGASDYKARLMAQLESVVSGGSTGKAQDAETIRVLILERGTSTEIDGVPAPGLLRFIGENERLFEEYGDQILASEEPQMRAMFGDEWEDVLNEFLLWQADREDAGTIDSAPADMTDITGVPVEAEALPEPAQPELAQTAVPPAQAAAAPDRYGPPDPFGLRDPLPAGARVPDPNAEPAPQAAPRQMTEANDGGVWPPAPIDPLAEDQPIAGSPQRRKSVIRYLAHQLDPKVTADRHIKNIVHRYGEGDPQRLEDITPGQLRRAMEKRADEKQREAASKPQPQAGDTPELYQTAGDEAPVWAGEETREVDGYRLRNGRFGANKNKWAVDEGGELASGFYDNPQEAIASMNQARARGDEVAAARQARQGIVDRILAGEITAENATEQHTRAITGGYKLLTTTSAVSLLRALGMRATDAQQAIKRARMAGETSGGATLYGLGDVLEVAKIPQPAPGAATQPTLFQAGDEAPAFNPNGNGVPPGGTPAPEPAGSTMDEVLFEQIQPLLRQAREDYTAAMQQRPVSIGSLDAQNQQAIRDYMKQVELDLASTKYAAMNYGQQMRDSALLNYNRRYGFDQMMELVFPYQFWYTRSMVEWAKRMVDKPSWFAMYARLKDAQERSEANMPERLRGKMRLPAPWLPEWAGGGLWFDPMSKFLPFSTFGQPLEQYANSAEAVKNQAERALIDMVESERITQAEADQAIQDKAGPIWDRAIKQAEADLDKKGTPGNFVGMMMQPSLWWTAGKNLLAGTPEKISPLPITRTAGAIETATRGTALEGLGQIAGLAAYPERAARRAAGLSEFGEWGDWYIDRQIANMAAEGLIDAKTAARVMIERKGPIFEDARARVQYEQMLQVPGAAMINQLASGQFTGAAQAIPTLIFGGSLFPEGELKLRGLSDDYSRAWEEYKRGDDEALDRFFKDHPEYEARLALNDQGEERLRQFLVSEVWDKFMSLEKPNRTKAADAMGDQFRTAFLAKDTRSYESIPVEMLARWTQMLQGAVPETEQTQPAIDMPEPPVELYPPALARQIEDYQAERKAKYPNYYAQQQAYFAVPEADRAGRKRILQRFPELKNYWDWKRAYQKEHPDMQPYFDGLAPAKQNAQPLTQQELAQVDLLLMQQVLAWDIAGQDMTPGAYRELQRLAKTRQVSAEEYAKMILMSLAPTQ